MKIYIHAESDGGTWASYYLVDLKRERALHLPKYLLYDGINKKIAVFLGIVRGIVYFNSRSRITSLDILTDEKDPIDWVRDGSGPPLGNMDRYLRETVESAKGYIKEIPEGVSLDLYSRERASDDWGK